MFFYMCQIRMLCQRPVYDGLSSFKRKHVKIDKFLSVLSSVADQNPDPDLSDPHVYGPPGSISRMYPDPYIIKQK
jgi:hypothetical protein